MKPRLTQFNPTPIMHLICYIHSSDSIYKKKTWAINISKLLVSAVIKKYCTSKYLYGNIINWLLWFKANKSTYTSPSIPYFNVLLKKNSLIYKRYKFIFSMFVQKLTMLYLHGAILNITFSVCCLWSTRNVYGHRQNCNF